MNRYRRLLSVLLIALSCFYAIAPAAALNAHSSGAGDGGCSDIGPTVFNLGLGNASGMALSVPVCLMPESANSEDSPQKSVVRVPIEGSIMVMDETPAFVIAAENNAAVESNGPDQVPGRPDQIGPTI